MEVQKYFGVIDYIIFGVTLMISVAIGLYFGCKKQRETSSPTEYLLASRSISWFPIFVSLVVSFFSPIGVMGITAKIYSTGITFALNGISVIVPIVVNVIVFAPMFRKLELVSVNEYLERRFSRGVRLLGSFFFILQYLLYLSIVLYTPTLALETVANVPKPATILVTGVICTFYTTLGGMRAVVWTDVFQAAVMFVGLVATAVIGVVNIGSIGEVFRVTKEYKRLDVNFNPDPRSYHTIWGCIIGNVFTLMNSWTISQPTVQRIVSAKSLNDAKKALFCSFAGIVFIRIVLTLDAFVIFASFFGCDPLLSGQIKAPDQILPYFVVNKLGHLKGVPGLFAASLFCFSLSTLSSALNSMSAIVLEDIVKTFKPNISEDKQTVISKAIVCICGAFVTGFSFVVPSLGKYVIKLAIQLFGVIGGPYFGLFAMGVFTRRARPIGAAVGSIAGFCFGMILSVGQMIYPVDMELPPVSMATCPNGTVAYSNATFMYPKPPPRHNNTFADFVSISYLWHGVISIMMTCFVCYFVSLCFTKTSDSNVDAVLIFNFKDCSKTSSSTYKIEDNLSECENVNSSFYENTKPEMIQLSCVQNNK